MRSTLRSALHTVSVPRPTARLGRVPRPKLPLRTAVFARALERFGRSSIVGLDEAGILAARQWAAPQRWPHTWVTGGVSERVAIRDLEFPTRDGAARGLRVYSPRYAAGPHPIVVFFHGGGYVLGNTRMYDPLCSFIGKALPAVVVSVDYRQAPEHRAPTALYDCIDALAWVHAHAWQLRGDAARIALCGDSAGGGLAALVCHATYDAGGPAIAHQALIYPCTDATQSFPSAAEHERAPVLSAEKIRIFTEHYLADVIDPTDPLVSAFWREDLRGMPPALVQTADLDPLRDEGLAYAERLADAGVPVRATNYLRTVHGFMSFPGATLIGEQARYELVTELRRHVCSGGARHPGRLAD